jgi:glycosyltransferase involved in cell wall biosynthesis
MRILVAHQVPRARTGGMSRLMGFIHDRVESAGHEIDYLCADDVPPHWRSWYGRRIAFPMAVRSKANEAERAGRPYDIINVHEPSAVPIILGRRRHTPAVVITSHGLERRAWELALEEGRLGREGPRWRTRMSYPATSLWPGDMALRRADHVFCLNEEDKTVLVDRYNRSPESITRVHPGADDIYARAAGRRDYAAVRRVLFAATWRKNKGIEDLVPAFTLLAERYTDLVLDVVGAGAPACDVQAQFPPSVRARIVCATPGDEAATAAAFAAADLFLLPSLFEGTPLTLIQAMMSGLPIVTTATCGMKDVIEHERTGLLVPIRAGGAIVAATSRLIEDRALRARLGIEARCAAAQRYTWDHAAEPVLRTYEALAA